MSMTPSSAEPARVVSVNTTPIKGFAMQESAAAFVTDKGIVGDRAFFLMDEAGKLLSATRTACFLRYWARYDPELDVLAIGTGDETLLEETVSATEPARAHFFSDRYATGRVVGGPWSRVLSEIAGQPLRLVRADGPLGGYDVHHVSLAAESSVRALTPDPQHAALDSRRFRMTFTIEGVPPFTEDTWVGERLCIGDCLVRIVIPVRRCAAVQKHPDGLEADADPLRRIKEVRGPSTTAHGRGLHLGVYAEVAQAGLVRVGDSVRRVEG